MDADIGFTPEHVFRLIESGADMVAGVYPIKRVDWGKVRRVIESQRPKLSSAVLDYVWRSAIPIMSPSSTALRACATPEPDS